jgi:hypothetical protein
MTNQTPPSTWIWASRFRHLLDLAAQHIGAHGQYVEGGAIGFELVVDV